MGRRRGLLVLVACAATLTLTSSSTSAATSADPSDFNGDGYADLAVGVPFEGGDLGAVSVIYGASGGLTEHADQSFSRDTPGVKGTNDHDRFFGYTLASADFDRDGYADLAIGGAARDATGGTVNVLYGSATGITIDGDQLWSAGTLGLDGSSFGAALAVGDFDHDGFADLVIGAPREPGGGALVVLNGTAAGLTLAGMRRLSQASSGVQRLPGGGVSFGSVFAVGDIDDDGYDDLAVSVKSAAKGAVNILFGAAAGLTGVGSQLWSQDTPGVQDESQTLCDPECSDEGFAFALAIGDFDDDGSDDLAIGVPFELTPSGGAVNVLYGSQAGLTAEGDQFWNQDVPGIGGTGELADQFGLSLAAGDLNGDGAAPPGHRISCEVIGTIAQGIWGHGVVHALYGSPFGLSARRSQVWSQATAGVPGSPEPYDQFGERLAVADYGRTRSDDLVIGVPWETIGDLTYAGMVEVVYGRSTGLSSTGVQAWDQATKGILGTTQALDAFGYALTP